MTRRPGHGGRVDLPGVLHRLAITASRIGGFRAVAVNLRRPDGAYEVVADTEGELLGTRTPEGFWAALLAGGHSVGNAYLIPPEHMRRTLGAYPEVRSVAPDLPPAAAPGDWDPDHMLIVPMRSRGGETIGYFSVDSPADGRIPGPEPVSHMETFAEHAALTAELEAEAEALRESEDQLRHRAFHDSLTGLPNRALFLDRLDHALERTRRRERSIAVLYLDIDRLKRVNDSLGHDAGDALLVAIAERLRAAARSEDTVARLSGDEFAVLLEDIGDPDGAVPVAERILGALAAPFVIAEHEVVATASIGIAVGSHAGTAPASLLQAADVAMYRAKLDGGARYAVYGSGMVALALERLELETQLRRAIERGQFEVHYQPKVDLATGRIVGVEALVRWRHPERGLLPPSAFLGLAEETGLIVPIGRWVLGQACRQVCAWRDRYRSDPPLVADVNLSGREFGDPGIVGEVERVLRETGLDPDGLELEITESVVMADDEAVAATLRELEALGVRLAIDDFGTGYSSLAHLKRFPISTVKIDREFVRGLDRDPEDTAIVRAVLGLGRTLGLKVVAEGAETAEQLAALRALGCTLVQGYYLSRPLPAKELELLLSGARRLG